MSSRLNLLPVLALPLLVIVSFLLFNITEIPLLSDSQHHYFIAERCASGIPPHLSQFEIKTSLPNILSGWAIYLGSGLGMCDVYAMRIWSVACLLLVLLFGSRLFRQEFGNRLVWTSVMLTVFLCSGYIGHVFMGCRPKTFIVLFLILYLYFYEQRHFFLAGIAAACCLLSYQPMLILVCCFALAIVNEKSARSGLIRFIAGYLLALITYLLFLYQHNIVAEAYLQSLYFPYHFRLSGSFDPLQKIIKLMKSWHMGYGSIITLPILSIVLYNFGKSICQFFKTRQTHTSSLHRHILICTISLGGIAVFELQGYPDTYILMPSLLYFWGLSLNHFYKKYPNRQFRIFGFYLIAILLLFIGSGLRLQGKLFHINLRTQFEQAVQLEKLTGPQSLFAVDCNHLLALRHRNNWDNYALFGKPALREKICADSLFRPKTEIRADLPVFILTTENGIPFCSKTIASQYDTLAVNLFHESVNPKVLLKKRD